MQTYHTALLPLTWCKSCLHLGYFWACCLTVFISYTHTKKKSQQGFCLQFCWHLLKHSSFLTHISSRSIWFIFYLFIYFNFGPSHSWGLFKSYAFPEGLFAFVEEWVFCSIMASLPRLSQYLVPVAFFPITVYLLEESGPFFSIHYWWIVADSYKVFPLHSLLLSKETQTLPFFVPPGPQPPEHLQQTCCSFSMSFQH